MFSKFFKKASSFAKRVFGSFSPDEYNETTEEIVHPGAFNWNISNTYSINSGNNYSPDYNSSESSLPNQALPTPISASKLPQSLDNSISELSQKLLEEARRYPMDFTREELY